MAVGDHFDLTGRVAVVTGGSRGLGRSMVRAFADAGADVVISSHASSTRASRSPGRSRRRSDSARSRWPATSATGTSAARSSTRCTRFGRVDVFVNNAGMSPLYENLASVTEELYDKTFAVNLKGRSGWARSSARACATPVADRSST